mmetsp:Transcript_89323/g.133933  ORF Transcript_89323/g.133933 Transcript_89323/m.133933 type:complete len:82 (+) Transcript_89323:806-1051(+)
MPWTTLPRLEREKARGAPRACFRRRQNGRALRLLKRSAKQLRTQTPANEDPAACSRDITMTHDSLPEAGSVWNGANATEEL